jgi:hypothetical protein
MAINPTLATRSLIISWMLISPNAHASCTPDVVNESDLNTTLTSSHNNDCVENSGAITTSGTGAYGIDAQKANASISNFGTIITNGQDAYGIYAEKSNSSITNAGNITTNGAGAYAIYAGGANASVSNATNSGTINVKGINSAGILSDRNNAKIINTGSITTNASGSHGVSTIGSFLEITNFGTISASDQNAYGIYSEGSSLTLNNTGTIHSTGTNSAAIYLSSSASYNTINLNRGSVIIGDIYNNDATGAALNINLGSGASYAYSVTGPWTVTDLDNRPMVTGSAYAAGIGGQETASEMLYQLTSAITSSLDRRLRSYASAEVDNQPYWLDVYYSDLSRNSGGNYSTQTAFSNYNYGITAGFKLPNETTPLELIVNVAQSNLNIDSGNQKVDSTSLMTGLLAPDLADILGAKLSAKAMVGYIEHDGDRKVMTNSLLYNGSRQIKSDYNSVYGVVGTALTKLYPITDRLTADVILGLDLNTQRFESYKETDYFAWDSRILTQLQSRVQTGLDYKLWGDKGSVFARVGAEHRDLIGGATQDYAINGTNVSFNTNNKNDTYLTLQVGVRAQLEKRIQLFGVVNTLHSSDGVNSVSGNIGLRADF